MIQSLNSLTTSSKDTTPPAKPVPPAVDPLANESTFLKLLVTQLKNQDPSSPQDGTQFVAQLAQFSGLEQQIQMRQDLDTISKNTPVPVPPTTAKT